MLTARYNGWISKIWRPLHAHFVFKQGVNVAFVGHGRIVDGGVHGGAKSTA